MELGGKSPQIVFADADLEAMTPMLSMNVFGGTGQMCIAGSRVFVQREAYDEVLERVAAFADSLVVGDPLEPDTALGPVVSQEQLDRVVGYMDSGREEGARVLAGGSRLTDGGRANGYYVPPTLLPTSTTRCASRAKRFSGP